MKGIDNLGLFMIGAAITEFASGQIVRYEVIGDHYNPILYQIFLMTALFGLMFSFHGLIAAWKQATHEAHVLEEWKRLQKTCADMFCHE